MIQIHGKHNINHLLKIRKFGLSFLDKFVKKESEHLLYHSILMAAFILLHAYFYVGAGGIFIFNPSSLWQAADLELLRSRPFETLFYLHIQPPLFNAYISAVENLFHPIAKFVHHAMYVGMGAASLLLLFHLLVGFRIARLLACFLALTALLSPSWILYEHWFMYTFPVMFLLCATIYLCHRFAANPNALRGFWFLFGMVLLAYTRSIFNIVWFLIILTILFHISRVRISVFMQMACIPVLLVLMLITKNGIVFGEWNTSSWLGPNLLLMTSKYPSDIRISLVQQGKISIINQSNPFLPIDQYKNKVNLDFDGKTGIPVLDRSCKRDGRENYNHHGYLEVHKIQLHDAVALIQASPYLYFKKAGESYLRFFQPSWNYPYFLEQPRSVHKLMAGWNTFFLGYKKEAWDAQQTEMRIDPGVRIITIFAPFLIVLTLLAVAAPRRYFGLSAADSAALWYSLLTMIMVIMAASFLLAHENNRLQFMITPFVLLLEGFWLQKGFDFIHSIWTKKDGGSSP